MRAFEEVFKNIFATLKASTDFVALVPQDNIRPYNDPSEPKLGTDGNGVGLFTYAWQGAQWDKVHLRGTGTLIVIAEHPDSEAKAAEIFSLFRDLCDEDTLSGNGVVIHLMKEQDAFNDTVPPKLGRFSVTSAFMMKLIEG